MPDTSRNSRSQRNNRYSAFDFFMAERRHSAAAIAWRWRTELAILFMISAAVWRLGHLITFPWATVVVGLVLTAAACLPWTRRRFWCVLARHRVHRLCWEARLHTRSGRLPLVLWTRPTKTGERLFILCRAGICAADFEDNRDELAAACFARAARASHHPRWSHLVTIDIIRHDLLAPKRIIPADIAADSDS